MKKAEIVTEDEFLKLLANHKDTSLKGIFKILEQCGIVPVWHPDANLRSYERRTPEFHILEET